MGFLTGKKILITGVISNRSIAYAIVKARNLPSPIRTNASVSVSRTLPLNSAATLFSRSMCRRMSRLTLL